MATENPKSVFTRMMESGDFSDLKFTCNGEEFKVHKVVVCGHSPVIKAALKEGFKEAETNVIVMDEFQPDTVKRMVQFMYTGDYWGEGDEGEPSSTDEKASSEHENEDENETDEAYLQEDEPEPGNDEDDNASNASSPPPSSKSAVTASLFKHVRVNSIGDYYDIESLVSLANTKIKRFLQRDCEDKTWVSELPTAIETVAGSTGDDELLGILASVTAANISPLLEVEEFKNLSLISDFSLQVLQGCALELKALKEEVEEGNDQKKRLQDLETDFFEMNRSVGVLNRTKECRNCSMEFPCFIDTNVNVLRCAKCRCRHKY